MATCGYENLKMFQKAEVMIAPSAQTEGKALQQSQRVGMGTLERACRAMHEGTPTVLVVDFGAQYAQLIARRVREAQGLLGDRPATTSLSRSSRDAAPAALILSGGPASVYADGAPDIDPAIFGLGIPILGFCYGMQLMARDLGGEIPKTDIGEYGHASLTLTDADSDLLAGLPAEQQVLDESSRQRRHGSARVSSSPARTEIDARSPRWRIP